jgi:5-hydroxyisourate hydrolase
MSGLSTHILDTTNGRPAAGIKVSLHKSDVCLSSYVTNENGRITALLPIATPLEAGTYRLVFDVASYFPKTFFPEVVIVFNVADPDVHYHVPLLLSPFGYSTYRGS